MSTLVASRDQVEQMVRSILRQHMGAEAPANGQAREAAPRVVANISARHCHLTQQDVKRPLRRGLSAQFR